MIYHYRTFFFITFGQKTRMSNKKALGVALKSEIPELSYV